MIKNISNVWKLNVSELYMMLAVVFCSGIVGMLIVSIAFAADQESTTVTAGGTFFALLIWAIVNAALGIAGYQNNFNLIVSLGCTRKDYMIAQIATVYLNMISEMVLLFLIYVIEKTMWKIIFPNKEYTKLVEYVFEHQILLAIILLVPAIRLFVGAVILRFEKIAYWTIWAVWMIGGWGCGNIMTYLAHHHESWLFVLVNNVKNMSDIMQMISICLITVVLLILTYHFTKKQAVYV